MSISDTSLIFKWNVEVIFGAGDPISSSDEKKQLSLGGMSVETE